MKYVPKEAKSQRQVFFFVGANGCGLYPSNQLHPRTKDACRNHTIIWLNITYGLRCVNKKSKATVYTLVIKRNKSLQLPYLWFFCSSGKHFWECIWEDMHKFRNVFLMFWTERPPQRFVFYIKPFDDQGFVKPKCQLPSLQL